MLWRVHLVTILMIIISLEWDCRYVHGFFQVTIERIQLRCLLNITELKHEQETVAGIASYLSFLLSPNAVLGFWLMDRFFHKSLSSFWFMSFLLSNVAVASLRWYDLNIHLWLERLAWHGEIIKMERNPISKLALRVKRIMYWNSWASLWKFYFTSQQHRTNCTNSRNSTPW